MDAVALGAHLLVTLCVLAWVHRRSAEAFREAVRDFGKRCAAVECEGAGLLAGERCRSVAPDRPLSDRRWLSPGAPQRSRLCNATCSGEIGSASLSSLSSAAPSLSSALSSASSGTTCSSTWQRPYLTRSDRRSPLRPSRHAGCPDIGL